MRRTASRPVLETETLTIDLWKLHRSRGEDEPQRLRWRAGEKLVGEISYEFEAEVEAVLLRYFVTEEAGLPPTPLSFKIFLQKTRCTFGWRSWFSCPTCDRRCRLLHILLASPAKRPACRFCITGRYLNDIYRRHPWLIRRRAQREIYKAEELLGRRYLSPEQRARVVDLLEHGERLLAEHHQQAIAHAEETADALEARLEDARSHDERAA